MRLNIIYFLMLVSTFQVEGQLTIERQNFIRKNLQFELSVANQGEKPIRVEAIGATSSFITLDVCKEEETKTQPLSDLSVIFNINQESAVKDLEAPIEIAAGQSRAIQVFLQPQPQAVCDYWETEVRLLLGTSEWQKVYTDPVLLTEDDYFNQKDWLEVRGKKEEASFVPNRISRSQLAEILKSGDREKIPYALSQANKFYWPIKEFAALLRPFLTDKDTSLNSAAEQALQEQQQKMSRAKKMLGEHTRHQPSQITRAIIGLGLARDTSAIPVILAFWKKEKNTEPHLVARTLIQLEAPEMLPDLRTMARSLEQEANEKGGFSHDRWKWLTVAAILAHYGDGEALELLRSSLNFTIDNYEFEELQLILESLQQSNNETLKKALSPYYTRALQLDYAPELRLSALPLYMAYADVEKGKKAELLRSFLATSDVDLKMEVIELAGKHRVKDLLPELRALLEEVDGWEMAYVLRKSMERLK